MSARLRFYLIVLLFVAMGMLSYLDRQTVGVLKPAIKLHFGFGDDGYAAIVNVFLFTYAGAYLGVGWVVERFGLRRAVTYLVAGWSFANLGCGLVNSLSVFVALRGLLGLMEPVVSPGLVFAMTLWCAPDRRASWMSICGAGGAVGTIVASPAIALLAKGHSWSLPFVVPGLAGLVVAGVFWLVYRNPVEIGEARPEQPRLNWAALWRHPVFWRIVLLRFMTDPVWSFFVFWMPGFIQERRGLTVQQWGTVGWIPFLAATAGGLALSAWSDQLGRGLSNPAPARIRLLLQLSLLAPVVCLAPWVGGLPLLVTLISVAGIIGLSWLYILQALVADQFPAGNVASIWGIAGTFGSVGAIIGNYLIGRLGTLGHTDAVIVTLGFLQPVGGCLLWYFSPRSQAAAAVPVSV